MPAAKNTETKTASRTQTAQVLGIDIAVARTCGHMKNVFSLPAGVSDELKKLRDEQAKLKSKAKLKPNETKKLDSCTARIKEINKSVVRIGGKAPIVVAIVADHIVKTLLRHAMDHTQATDHKTAKLKALHRNADGNVCSITELGVWPLIRDLPAIKDYDPAVEEELKAARAAAARAAKEAKEAGEPLPEPENKDTKGDGLTKFTTYVGNAEKTVKADEKYSNMCVSIRLREVLSDVVAQFVKRVSESAMVTVLELLKVRTLNSEHVITIIKSQFAFFGASPDELLELIGAKLTAYQAHVSAENARRIQEMTPEELAAMATQKAQAEQAKKAKRASSYKEKAIHYANLAKGEVASS